MTRVMAHIGSKEYSWARSIMGASRPGEATTEFLSEALLFMGNAYLHGAEGPSQRQRAFAVAFWLGLGRSLDILSSREAYGSNFTPRPANSNKPGGKCSSKPKPRRAQRRRKLKLSVVT